MKTLINILLGLLLFILIVDTCPINLPGHGQLKKAISPWIHGLGLWQGSWTLFAPNPDKQNTRLKATFRFSDGESAVWWSPEWHKVSPLCRFLHFRRMEYVDAVRRNSNKAAWPSFADYLARLCRHPEGVDLRPQQTSLDRYWSKIPPPTTEILRDTGPWIPFNRSFEFYRSPAP